MKQAPKNKNQNRKGIAKLSPDDWSSECIVEVNRRSPISQKAFRKIGPRRSGWVPTPHVIRIFKCGSYLGFMQQKMSLHVYRSNMEQKTNFFGSGRSKPRYERGPA